MKIEPIMNIRKDERLPKRESPSFLSEYNTESHKSKLDSFEDDMQYYIAVAKACRVDSVALEVLLTLDMGIPLSKDIKSIL